MSTASWEICWLACHPEADKIPPIEIKVDIGRGQNGFFWAEFRASGAVDSIEWPRSACESGNLWHRSDGLWQHSCFEVLVRRAGCADYLEFNFASSYLWAGYAFDGYRAGMRECPSASVAKGDWQMRPGSVSLNAILALPPDYCDAELQLGLSAVIEGIDGNKTYWALAHPPGKPDFHDPACFAATLGAPKAT